MPTSAEGRQIAVYEAVIREVCSPAHNSMPVGPVIHISKTTDDRAADSSLKNPPSVVLSAVVQDGLTKRLADLPAKVTWAESFQAVELDGIKGPPKDGGSIIRLGNISPHADGTLHVPASIYWSGTAAWGTTCVLKRHRGRWRITDFDGGWVS
jgi:hypothetical protein